MPPDEEAEAAEASGSNKRRKTESGAAAASPSQHFYCPITHALMLDPVITLDGQAYERHAIRQWFAEGKRTSPCTGLALKSTELVPAALIRSLMEELLADSEDWQQRKQDEADEEEKVNILPCTFNIKIDFNRT